MSDLTTLTELCNSIAGLLKAKDISNPKLKQNIKACKISIYSKDNLETQSEQYLAQALKFAELNLLYTLSARIHKEFEIAIDGVKFFYENSFLKTLPSTHALIIAVQLLFLLSSNRSQQFFTRLESLSTSDLADPQIRYVLLLNDAIEEGNYRKVFQLRKDNTNEYFAPFLDSISDTVRIQIAKSAEKAYSHISLKQALNVFQVESFEELKKFISHYEENQEESPVKWVLTVDRIQFEKESQNKIKFNSDELIKTSLEYAIQLQKIA